MKNIKRKKLASEFKSKLLDEVNSKKELLELYLNMPDTYEEDYQNKIQSQREDSQRIHDIRDNFYEDNNLEEVFKNQRKYSETNFFFNSLIHDIGNSVIVVNLMAEAYHKKKKQLEPEFKNEIKHNQRCIDSTINLIERNKEKEIIGTLDLINEATGYLGLEDIAQCTFSDQTKIYGDKNSVYRAFFNILNNVKKRKGTNIKINISSKGKYVKITFSNENTVIDDTKNIFKYNMKEETHLGLKISHKIIKDNKGKIKAYNINKNTGIVDFKPDIKDNLAVFEVYLPKAKQ